MSQKDIEAWKSDVWRWRFYGIAAYNSFLISNVTFALSLASVFFSRFAIRKATPELSSPWHWLLFLLALVLLTATLAAEAFLLRLEEPRPPYWLRRVLRLPAWNAQPVANLLAHVQTLGGIIDLLVYYAASAAAGAVGTYHFCSILDHNGVGWAWWYGLMLGVLYATSMLAGGRNVVTFPIIHQKRWFALKKELPKAIPAAAILPTIALGLTMLLRFTFLRSQGGGWSLHAMVRAQLAGAALTFCFYLGSCLLNIVMTEHLRFALPGDADPNAKLFAVLQGEKDPIWQSLALQDLSFLSQQGPSEQWRRAAIFNDLNGAAWKIPVHYCLREMEEVAKQVASVLPQAGAKPGEPRAELRTAPKWNAHPASTKPLGPVGRGQEEAAWYIRARCWRGVQCMRALAGLSVASRSEDRLGTAQLSEPSIGTIAGVLGSTVLALQAYSKTAVAAAPRGTALTQQSMGPDAPGARRSKAVGAPVFGLHDAALAALYSILEAFGSEIVDVVKTTKMKLPFGTAADVVGLLNRCSANSE